LAVIYHIPFIGIAYAPKILGFLKEVNQEKSVVSMDEAEVGDFKKMVLNVWGKMKR